MIQQPHQRPQIRRQPVRLMEARIAWILLLGRPLASQHDVVLAEHLLHQGAQVRRKRDPVDLLVRLVRVPAVTAYRRRVFHFPAVHTTAGAEWVRGIEEDQEREPRALRNEAARAVCAPAVRVQVSQLVQVCEEGVGEVVARGEQGEVVDGPGVAGVGGCDGLRERVWVGRWEDYGD